MRVWTNTTFRALDLLAGPEPASDLFPAGPKIAAILDRLVAANANCVFTRIDHGRGVVEARLQRITSTFLVIGRPQYRPGQRVLGQGEHLEMRIAMPEGTYLSQTRVMSKYATEGEAARTAAYRLTKPVAFMIDDRRANERIGFASVEPARAELLCAPRHKPLGFGDVTDLSTGGMRVRASDANVRPGDRVMVRARLNDEFRVHALGIVVHTGARDDGTTDVGLHFQTDQPDIERFIRVMAVKAKG